MSVIFEQHVHRRKEIIDWLRHSPPVSVLIVGGGINGAGLFREIALQGVDVLLVDRSDFCTGASCASSRMIHGGLRYLEFGEFRLVQESLKERNLLLKNAPHYVKPLPTTIPVLTWTSGIASCIGNFLGIPITRPSRRGALMIKAGLVLYDVFTRKNIGLPRHQFKSKRLSLTRRPALNPKIICTATYYDAWISYPERLCFELLEDGSAGNSNALAVNYVSLQSGGHSAVQLKDELTGEFFSVYPSVVVNATGAWIDFTNRKMGIPSRMIGGTKGAHLVVDNPELLQALDGEMIYFENRDGRVAVALPWLGKALIGSTDIRIEDPDDARCEKEEILYILEALHEAFPSISIDQSQIVSFFSGVRPLPYTEATSTVQISRDHHCAITEPNGTIDFPVYSMIGGKWTTFRGFSEQVADQLLYRLGRSRVTHSDDIQIGGGKFFPLDGNDAERWIHAVQERTGVDRDRLMTLVERYGTKAETIAEFIAAGHDTPLKFHKNYSYREIEYLLSREQVERLDDLVLRRTAMALLGELTRPLLSELSCLMGTMRGWSEERINEEVQQTAHLLKSRNGIDL